MESKMSRPRSWRDLYLSLFVQFPAHQVHLINHDFIETQVGNHRKMVFWVRQNTVCMRTSLTLGMNAGAGVLDHIRCLTQLSICSDRNHGNTSTGVVGY